MPQRNSNPLSELTTLLQRASAFFKDKTMKYSADRYSHIASRKEIVDWLTDLGLQYEGFQNPLFQFPRTDFERLALTFIRGTEFNFSIPTMAAELRAVSKQEVIQCAEFKQAECDATLGFFMKLDTMLPVLRRELHNHFHPEIQIRHG